MSMTKHGNQLFPGDSVRVRTNNKHASKAGQLVSADPSTGVAVIQFGDHQQTVDLAEVEKVDGE